MKQRGYKIDPFIMPPAYPDYNLPPTIYSILNSICNFDEADKTKIKDLARNGRIKIFDFNYPLSYKVKKDEFETMILNKFLMRRIGYETVTAFKIALEVKLNEIMPMYNKMFDMLDGWNLFEDGEHISRTTSDAGTNSINNMSSTSSTTSTSNVSDRRYSDTPQDQLADVRDGKYITDYNYDTDNGSSTDSGSASSTTTGSDSRNTIENITRTPSDKMKIYKEFIENKKSILTMIYEDLEELFYGLC